MARPRKPTKLKAALGTLQKCRTNANEWTPPEAAPPEPKGLGKIARECWRTTVSDLMAAGVLAKVDGVLLECFCRAYEQATVYGDIAMAEPMVETFSGLKPNPAAKVAQSAGALATRIGVEFGLSPAGRSRVSAKQEDPGAKDEEFLFGGGLIPVTQGKPEGVQ